jgi:DNA-binding winged helix-turn-helix (wHTH) protein
MDEKTDLVYEFAGFRLHVARLLVHNGERVSLTAKGFDILLLLMQSRAYGQNSQTC